MLRGIYNLDKIAKEDDEIKYILKIVEAAGEVVTLGDVNDTKALNGYDIIRLIEEKKTVSAKDMAIIIRDFITSVGYNARVGEIRCSKKDEDKYDRYYILTINNSTDKELYRRVIKNKEIDFKDYKKNAKYSSACRSGDVSCMS